MLNLASRWPVLLGQAVNFVLAGGVALGWWVAPQGTATAATGLGVILVAGVTWLMHNAVTPVASSTPAAPAPAPAPAAPAVNVTPDTPPAGEQLELDVPAGKHEAPNASAG
jgi:hypothetical protein